MPERPEPPSLVALIAQGVLDAELAALIWVLVEGGVPLVVAAPPGRAGAGGQLIAGVIGSIRAGEDVEALIAPITAAGASSLVQGRRAGGVLEAGSLGEIRARLGSGPLPLTPDQLTFLGCVLVLGESAGGRRGRLRTSQRRKSLPIGSRPASRSSIGEPRESQRQQFHGRRAKVKARALLRASAWTA